MPGKVGDRAIRALSEGVPMRVMSQLMPSTRMPASLLEAVDRRVAAKNKHVPDGFKRVTRGDVVRELLMAGLESVARREKRDAANAAPQAPDGAATAGE